MVDLLLQFLHGLGVGGQVVEEEGQGAAGGLVAGEDEDHCLRQNLVGTQACEETETVKYK